MGRPCKQAAFCSSDGRTRSYEWRITTAAFVTSSGYTEKARKQAEREGFKRSGLVEGKPVVDILAEEYERLPIEVREKLGLRGALVFH